MSQSSLGRNLAISRPCLGRHLAVSQPSRNRLAVVTRLTRFISGHLIQECRPYLSRLLGLWFRREALPLYEIHDVFVEFPFCYTEHFPNREFYAAIKNSLSNTNV